MEIESSPLLKNGGIMEYTDLAQALLVAQTEFSLFAVKL
jgi:hypothetical protein